MLTDMEVSGAEKLLGLLSIDEVYSLLKTVTHERIVVNSVQEAIQAIIVYTESPVDLLKRRKLKRDVLFKYLFNEKIYVSPDSNKVMIILAILKHWSSTEVSLTAIMNDEVTEAESSQGPDVVPRAPADDETEGKYWNDPNLSRGPETEELAIKFSEWFYKMLNACNPIVQINGAEPFGVQHFFTDCSLVVMSLVNCADNPTIERYTGSQLIVDRLTALMSDERLVLGPNLGGSGVSGYSDSFGRRVIMVRGTVHRANDVIGLFEQQFGLIPDPLANNNWKIKVMRLAFTASDNNGRSLPGPDITHNMIA